MKVELTKPYLQRLQSCSVPYASTDHGAIPMSVTMGKIAAFIKILLSQF